MATLEARLTAAFQRVRDQFNTIRPRLVPAGGTQGQLLGKTGSADYAAGWVTPGGPVALSVSKDGLPAAGELLFDLVAPYDFTITAAAGVATTAPNAVATLPLKQNGTQVATVTFAAAGTSASFNASTQVAVKKNDRIQFYAPATQDAAFAGFSITFIGVR